MTPKEAFVAAVMKLPDLPSLPEKAFLGDVCKHDCSYWVYLWPDGWILLDEANKRMMNASQS